MIYQSIMEHITAMQGDFKHRWIASRLLSLFALQKPGRPQFCIKSFIILQFSIAWTFILAQGPCSSEDSHSGTFQACHWEIEIRNSTSPNATNKGAS